MVRRQSLQQIPEPKPTFLLDNVVNGSARASIRDMVKLAKEYGPIFRLSGPLGAVVLSSFDLVNEVCDDDRFDKDIGGLNPRLRAVVGDGLFTAWTTEPIWGTAHRILLPAFGPRVLQSFVPKMLDAAEQLLMKWERLNPDDVVDVPGDMTRLTLETIGLCGFDYRFNSFYRETPHPLIQHLDEAIGLARELPATGPPFADELSALKYQQFEQDVDFLNATVDKIIGERKHEGPTAPARNDLLDSMLHGLDKKTGEGLPDQNIRYQTLTFLFAGHITTSSLLSWAIYFLLRNPTVSDRARDEADRVLGRDRQRQPTYKDVAGLGYVTQVLKETLRLVPVAPSFARFPREDTLLGGRFAVKKGEHLRVLTPMLHRDPSVWGTDFDAFNPDRFTREAEQARPANAYKPFGTGQRSCIGRQFALQEATLALGMILRRFSLIDFAHYQPILQELGVLKPANFQIKVAKRAVAAGPLTAVERPGPARAAAPNVGPSAMVAHATPLLVLYGSNTGTSEEFAHQIADRGTTSGFATSVAPLDAFARRLPTQGAVVIVTASYNGNPPDNALGFVDWLRSGELGSDALRGVKYAVFGCGNREWAGTYQKIPREVDEVLAAHGATRLCPRGQGDAAEDIADAFDDWSQRLSTCLADAFELKVAQPGPARPEPLYQIDVVSPHASHPLAIAYGALAIQTVRTMTVLENRELNNRSGPRPAGRSTRHIELALAPDVTYQPGDHLAIGPFNNPALVKRVTSRFDLDPNATIRLRTTASGTTFLPTNTNVRIGDLLSAYVELQDPATRKQIAVLADYAQCPPEKARLLELAGDDAGSRARYRTEVTERRRSLLDLLEESPSCQLPFEMYLSMLPRLSPRFYSISSSPLVEEGRCSITVGVVDGPARSGHGEYHGTCSTYLSLRGRGDSVFAFVRKPTSTFRLPDDSQAPIIMVGPGTGLAPFRGFLQHRSALKARGMKVGNSLLFFGCRSADEDFLYRSELEEFVQQGVTELFTAFSRVPGKPKTYVQDRIVEQRDLVWRTIRAGGIVYVCGDAGRMAPEVQQAFAAVYCRETGANQTAADAWMADLLANNRYRVDVWGSG